MINWNWLWSWPIYMYNIYSHSYRLIDNDWFQIINHKHKLSCLSNILNTQSEYICTHIRIMSINILGELQDSLCLFFWHCEFVNDPTQQKKTLNFGTKKHSHIYRFMEFLNSTFTVQFLKKTWTIFFESRLPTIFTNYAQVASDDQQCLAHGPKVFPTHFPYV